MKLSAWVKRNTKNLVSVQRLSCIAISTKVITRTPVLTGTARASWTPNNGAPIARNVTVSADTPMPTRNDVTTVANSLQPGDTFSLANAQPHIRPLEYDGHSAQAPNGMLRRSAAEWQQIVDGVVRGI